LFVDRHKGESQIEIPPDTGKGPMTGQSHRTPADCV